MTKEEIRGAYFDGILAHREALARLVHDCGMSEADAIAYLD
jgi:hypothetical protein